MDNLTIAIAKGRIEKDIYRRLKDLSQEALAIKAGLTRSYISKIERGTARCGLEVFFLIAQALEVDPAELISDRPTGAGPALK